MSNPVSIGSNGGATSATLATDSVTSTSSTTSNTGTSKASAAAAPSPATQARLQLNASIMQASLTVSLSSQNNPQTLVFKTALDGINQALQADFGHDAIQAATSQDNTPDGTASRIVSLSTGFFDAFKKQNPGLSDADVLQKFMDTIGSGVEQGFKEARDVLKGLGALGGDVASNIDKTYALVQQGYADFAASKQSAASGATTSASSTSSTVSTTATVTSKAKAA